MYSNKYMWSEMLSTPFALLRILDKFLAKVPDITERILKICTAISVAYSLRISSCSADFSVIIVKQEYAGSIFCYRLLDDISKYSSLTQNFSDRGYIKLNTERESVTFPVFDCPTLTKLFKFIISCTLQVSQESGGLVISSLSNSL